MAQKILALLPTFPLLSLSPYPQHRPCLLNIIRLTATIAIAYERKAPDIAEINSKPDNSQQELNLLVPVLAFTGLSGSDIEPVGRTRYALVDFVVGVVGIVGTGLQLTGRPGRLQLLSGRRGLYGR